jgi:uncharacterized protein DUF3306
MSDQENFLSRWNRRKQAAKHESKHESADDSDATRETIVPEPDADDPRRGASAVAPGESMAPPSGRAGADKPNEPPTFDVSTLPPLESITAESDIRAFLTKGVPAELTRAALRRAWSADPSIRDFVGMAENQWDFTAPNEIMGFGPLESGEDIARMVEDVFGNVRPPDTPRPDDQNLSAQDVGTKIADAADTDQVPANAREEESAAQDVVHCSENNTAAQYSEQSSDDLEPAQRRGHGRALPQ